MESATVPRPRHHPVHAPPSEALGCAHGWPGGLRSEVHEVRPNLDGEPSLPGRPSPHGAGLFHSPTAPTRHRSGASSTASAASGSVSGQAALALGRLRRQQQHQVSAQSDDFHHGGFYGLPGEQRRHHIAQVRAYVRGRKAFPEGTSGSAREREEVPSEERGSTKNPRSPSQGLTRILPVKRVHLVC